MKRNKPKLKKKQPKPETLARRAQWKRWIVDWMAYLSGSAIYALSVAMFTAPNDIAPGGISGIATLLNYLFGLPIGISMIVMNVPIVVIGWIKLGHAFVFKSAICMAISSVLIDVFSVWITPFEGDMILVALAGGVLAGAGLGLIFMRGASTGGTDIIAQLLERKLRHIPIGRFMLLLDVVVVAASVFVYGHLENALYASVTIFMSSQLIDTLIYGNDAGKMLLVSSKHEQEIINAIITQIDRGVTRLNAVGGYTGAPRDMLLIAVRRNEVYPVKQLVYDIDPSAFVITVTTDEVLGEGFKSSK